MAPTTKAHLINFALSMAAVVAGGAVLLYVVVPMLPAPKPKAA